jgi:acyl transferase domain-containing protein
MMPQNLEVRNSLRRECLPALHASLVKPVVLLVTDEVHALRIKLPASTPPLQVRLAVAGAFHTQYMAPAAEKLQEALNNTAISTPRIPVISNVDAQPHSDPAVIKEILAKQVRDVFRS